MFVVGQSPTIVNGYIRIRRGAGIEGRISFMQDDLNIPTSEKVFVTVKVEDVMGVLRGVQYSTEESGSYFSDFSIFGHFNYSTSELQTPTHFYYVMKSGFRIKDYGMGAGDYHVTIDEIGFDERFYQIDDILITLDSVYEVKSIFISVYKMGFVYGTVFGRNNTGDLVPLSWVKVSSGDRFITSLDGNFKLFLLDGDHTIDFAVPGYMGQQRIAMINDASVVGLDGIILEQSGLPFYSQLIDFTVLVQQPTHSEKGTEFILQANINSEIADPNKVEIKWHSENGLLNSTYGSCVKCIIPDEKSPNEVTVTAMADINQYGKVRQTVLLNSAEIPEFNAFMSITLIFISLTFVALGASRKSRFGKL
jgi:hypothetical protein